MGVVVTGREYKNRYRPEAVDWLIGNVGDWQTLTLSCEFSVYKNFTESAPLLIENNGFDLVTGDGTAWNEYGFDVGDIITWGFTVTVYQNNGNIQPPYPIDFQNNRQIVNIQGDRLTLDNAWINNISMMPFYNGRERIDKVFIFADKKPQGAKIRYGHLTNSEAAAANLNSFIDGTATEFIAEDMDTLIGWQDCDFIGLQSGMSLRSARWIFDGKEGDYTYLYRFEVEFMISSFFEDLDNFQNLIPPPQVFGAESLTDNFLIIGFPEWNNPNTQIKNDLQETKRLGNTGWFNENFNGLDNNFNVESLEYYDLVSGQPVSRLSYGGETKIKAVISGIPNLANGLTKLGIGFILVPEDESTYKEKPTPYHQNLFVNTAGGVATGIFTPSAIPSAATYTGYTNIAGARMDVRDVHFYIQGTNLVYEAIFKPTAGFKNYIDTLDEVERNYSIWVSVADKDQITNFSDRVNLLLDYNFLDVYVPPVGAFPNMSISLAEHPTDETGGRAASCGDFRVEDDLLAIVPFKVDVTGEIPNKIEFVLEVENIGGNGAKYELQRYAVDLSGFPNDGVGVPQWSYDETRGFKLEAGNTKNWVKIQRDAPNDILNNKAYLAYYGFKIRWEDWIARAGVPNVFFNASEENNGFNNDWINFLTAAGWRFQFTVYTYSTIDGAAVKYVNSFPFDFKDYDTNTDIDTDWEFIRESTGANLPVTVDPATGNPLGLLLKDEQVRLKVTYTNTAGNFAALSEYYGTICIEVDKGAGQFEFRQLSTVWGSEADNPLIPLQGENKTKKTLAAANQIVLECLVEPSLLQEAQRYKVSSRLGCLESCGGLEGETEEDISVLVFLDNSGSMDGQIKSLNYIRDNMIKDYLLPLFDDNEALYNQRVIVQNVNDERTLKMLNLLGDIPPNTSKLLVIVFQDEASTIYTDGNITPRTTAFESDLEEFRNRIEFFEEGYFSAAIMQLNGEGGVFAEFVNALETGASPYDGENGISDLSEIDYQTGLAEKKEAFYYMQQIITALQNLGYTINI